MKTTGIVVGIIAGVLLALLLAFRVLFVNFIDNYELGYKYDLRTGKIELVHKKGYVITPPVLVKVHAVDLRPMQVCINANARVLNCKLVQFNPDGLDLFLAWHGRNDYSGSGASTTDGVQASQFNQILMSYAFDGSGKSYPFLTVLRELKPEDVPAAVR